MPKKKYTGRRLFPLNQGRLRFLFMQEDDYVTKYCTVIDRKEYICRQLKDEGYCLVLGLDYRNGQGKIWTQEGDLVSDYVYRYPEESRKSLEQLLEALVKVPEDKQTPKKTQTLKKPQIQQSEVDNPVFNPEGERKPSAERRQSFIKKVPEIKISSQENQLQNAKVSNPNKRFEDTGQLIEMLVQSLRFWMNAREKIAFVVKVDEWNDLLEQDKKAKGRLENCYRSILENSKGLFLQVISPIGRWPVHYNKAVDLPSRWGVTELEPVDEKRVTKQNSYFRKLEVENKCISYVPALTVKHVEQMLIHKYLRDYPELPIDFSNLREEAKEIVYLMTTDSAEEKNIGMKNGGHEIGFDQDYGGESIAEIIGGIDKTKPMNSLKQHMFNDREEWEEFEQYMKERPPRYYSWADIPFEKIKELNVFLKKHLVGEDLQIDEFCEALEMAITECRNRAEGKGEIHLGPPVVIFMAGPSRTGKGEIVRKAVEFLFSVSSENSPRLHGDFNGNTQKAAADLLGAHAGTKGFDNANPFKDFLCGDICKFFLFDEIHSADEDVKNLFMQMMEKRTGKLTFPDQTTAYFEETIIVFTSNNGCEDDEKKETIPEYEELKEIVTASYNRSFKTPWRNRVDKFICFDYMREKAVTSLVFQVLEDYKREYPELSWWSENDQSEDVISYLINIGMGIRIQGAENIKKKVKLLLGEAIKMAGAPRKDSYLRLTVQEGVLTAEYLKK